jgi:Peptidase M15
MKYSALKAMANRILLIVTTLLLGGIVLHAQQVYGWTSLEWDSGNQTLYGYGETDLDDYAALYYEASIYSHISDQNNKLLTSGTATDEGGNEGFIDISLTAPGTTGNTYTMSSIHHGMIIYQSDCVEPCTSYYEDYYYYDSFLTSPADSVNYGGDFYWFGPGPDYNARAQPITLATTTSSATAKATGVCGDIRDTIIGEYLSYDVDLQPQCNFFTSGVNTEYFTYSQLNYPSPRTAPAKYPDAIFTEAALGFVNNWYSRVTFPINSGYRCPSQNAAAGGTHNSNHMNGVAFDAGNSAKTQAQWNALKSAAVQAGADWTEPQTGPCGLGCVHGDVRNHAVVYVNP